jgi:hypothetical protein
MRQKKLSINVIIPVLSSLIFILLNVGCERSTYEGMKSYIDEIKVVNTHSHQGRPWKKRYNGFDSGLYLHADLISSGMTEYSDSMEIRHSPEEYWDHTEEYLRFSRTTSYYTQWVYNYKVLYGLEMPHLTKADFLEFSEQMNQNFKQYDAWLESVFSKCNMDIIFCDRLWQAFDISFNSKYFRYVFRFDQLVLETTDAALSKSINNRQALELIGRDEFPVPDLQSYLDYTDLVLDKVVHSGAVSLKMGLAYHRSLDFKVVETSDAERVFQKGIITREDRILVQDFLVSHIVKKAGEHQIPIQIHTGYLHGNRGVLDRGHPMKLIPLLQSNPKTDFVLFHGGFPWTGDCMVLAKCYPNVFLDLVWLPQLSRSVAIRTLHEMLDCVPYNKICWGGDTGNIDDAAGSLELGREVVAQTLAERIENGWATREVAEDIANRIFRENAIEIYSLKIPE